MKNLIKTVIFDFDGTVADTFNVTLVELIKIADDFGFKGINEGDVKRYRKMDVVDIIKEAHIPFYKLPFLIRKGRKEISKKITKVKPINGIVEILNELKSKDLNLGILTSNSEDNVRIFLKANNINCFDFIYSESSLFGKGRVLKRLLKKYKLDHRSTVYIGDEPRDIKAAKDAKIKSIAVTWGFNARQALVKAKPDNISEKPKDLLKIIISG